MVGKLTISIDLELAWGFWDILTPEVLHLSEAQERPICDKLIELFERYHIPATWAVVAAVLDRASAAGRPGNEASWYAPEIIERIRAAKTPHEIGSHGGRHVYYDRMTAAEAEEDLAFIKQVHRDNGLALDSFVFPRNAVGYLDLVTRAGLRTFRGADTGWVRLAPKLGPRAGKIITFADKVLPLPPAPARAQKNGGLVDVPGSMLLPGRDGVRRFILPAVSRAKLAMGLAWAQRSGATFHFWFHPCNFYYRADEQFATLEWFLARAAAEASRGRIEICTMGSYAPRATDTRGAKAAA
ncbi:MAG: polysaccharide deacetylase family protein [Bradyrhizobiaceae bacterium]|nr:polysaccharide deacetylase family protein [Hyphomicrobiales bacterium]MBV9428697.1 polysaccharide deacetylase family protein [Bradyrhizobiaceae bacterium]